jgi:hypothetical protein
MIVRSRFLFTAVPTDASDIILFDQQIREVHSNTEYSQSVVNETDNAAAIVKILSVPSSKWTTANRQLLLDTVNQVCGGYT